MNNLPDVAVSYEQCDSLVLKIAELRVCDQNGVRDYLLGVSRRKAAVKGYIVEQNRTSVVSLVGSSYRNLDCIQNKCHIHNDKVL